MAKKISQLGQLLRTAIASGDKIPILDESAGQTKYVTVGDLVGIPDFGWTASGESWAYSAWSATTRIAEVTVPTDATTKYQPGMRVKFTQSTGGTKYGIIMKVEATKLHVLVPVGITFNNEALSDIFYSGEKAPLGFDSSPSNWMLELTDNSNRLQASPTINTWYNPGSLSLTVGVGKYKLSYSANVYMTHNSSAVGSVHVILHTANNSGSTSSKFYRRPYSTLNAGSSFGLIGAVYAEDDVEITSSTQAYYLNALTDAGSASNVGFWNSQGKAVIKAIPAYL